MNTIIDSHGWNLEVVMFDGMLGEKIQDIYPDALDSRVETSSLSCILNLIDRV